MSRSERTLIIQKHNDIIENYEQYIDYVAEKLRFDVVFLYTIIEKFVETVFKHKQYFAVICFYFKRFTTSNLNIELLYTMIEYIQPDSYLYQCSKCSIKITTTSKEQFKVKIKEKIQKKMKLEKFALQTVNQKIDNQ